MYDFHFILPPPSQVPVGGYKIVYEYANRLTESGYSIRISYICIHKSLLKNIASYIKNKGILKKQPWFVLNTKIRTSFLPPLFTYLWSVRAHFVVATAWQTAGFADRLAKLGKAQDGLYLIQGYEVWSGTEKDVLDSYGLGLRKIVISKWLSDILKSRKLESFYIPNGLNFEDFYITEKIESRKMGILSIYHTSEKKGGKDVVEAFKILKNRFRDANFCMFSAYPRPADLPDWIEYNYLPSQERLREIYNSASIFVAASHNEGWGLPACEAMQCGCALVASDIAGHREFAVNEDNSLLFEAGNQDDLALKVAKLLEDDPLRVKLAESGNTSIQRFKWSTSLKRFIDFAYGCDVSETE